MVNTQEGYKAVNIYQSVRRDGRDLMGKKIGAGQWDLSEGRLTISYVNDRELQVAAFHSPIEVLLTDYNSMIPEILAVGVWQITAGFSTGEFEEAAKQEAQPEENQFSS